MLQVTTGHFHPELERALLEDLNNFKRDDPLVPLTIVVPSEHLRDRLKWRLCHEGKLSLLNVHIFTFFQLAIRLCQKTASEESFHIRSDFYFQELIHHLLGNPTPVPPPWAHLADMPGAWAALWATMKDMKDAGLDTRVVAEWVNQWDWDQKEVFRELLALYEQVMQVRQEQKSIDQDDVTVLAQSSVTSSPFLTRQRCIFYYGFYDVTQVQLDVFLAIVRSYSTRLYFPLIHKHGAFSFAEQMFHRHLGGLMSEPIRVVPEERSSSILRALFQRQPDGQRTSRDLLSSNRDADFKVIRPGGNEQERISVTSPNVQIVQVSGVEDEVTWVAKGIMGWVRDRGIPFHDIGVVGRTVSDYTEVFPRIFGQHAIPFVSTMSRSLACFPFVKTAMQVLSLKESDFPRDQVMDVLSSPFFRLPMSREDTSPRPDLWDFASRRLGIVKGMEEWRRVHQVVERGNGLGKRMQGEDGAETLYVEAAQLQNLWESVSALHAAMDGISERGSWDDYASAAQKIWETFLVHGEEDRDSDRDQNTKSDRAEISTGVVSPARLWEQMRDGLQELRELQFDDQPVAFRDFVQTLNRLMCHSSISLEGGRCGKHGSAVRVMDAMSARGIPFRVLFVIGLTENIFPRHIKEDAFLRDHTRRLIETQLGFKIPEKLAGYEEEKLLFYLLVNSAGEALTLLFQRTDQHGQIQLQSSYLDEIRRIAGVPAEIVIPRSLKQKLDCIPLFADERLPPRELVIKRLLERRSLSRQFLEGYPGGTVLGSGLRFLRTLENLQSPLGGTDGLTGYLEEFWQDLKRRGLSPTSLEKYAKCPFQYFAGQVLRLQPVEVPETTITLGSLEVGSLVHAILKDCMQRDADRINLSGPAANDPTVMVQESAARVFAEYALHNPVGYPLLWELQQRRIVDWLEQVVRDDRADMEGKWEPVLLEQSFTALMPVNFPTGVEEFRLTGRVDRVDRALSGRLFRIIDYKYTEKRGPTAFDKNLLLGAVRGMVLQPPLYLYMVQANLADEADARVLESDSLNDAACEGVWFYLIAPNRANKDKLLTRVSFPGDAWRAGVRHPLDRALTTILQGIRSGEFYIVSGSYCDWCDFQNICRRTHHPTARRARTDQTRIQPLRDLRRTTVPETS